MNLDELCRGIAAEVNGYLGCAVVDLDTGLPLAMNIVPGSSLNSVAMECLSVASVDYFRGKTVWQLEMEMSGGAGASQAGFVHEIQTTTADMHHFMAMVPDWESTLFILVTGKNANLGLGWIAMRDALLRIKEMHEQDRAAIGVVGRSAPAVAQNAPQIGQPNAAAAGSEQGGGQGKQPAPSHPRAAEAGPRILRPVPQQNSSGVRVPGWRGGHGGRGLRYT